MVHLHSVSLRGFKSFAKPTLLTFEPGVTVIIGPNGSGKSNIADAVLWVLGEQSPGNLRGKSMQDVIFSGPGGRRSSAVAEVSLVFNNGDRSLPLDYEQLEVTRRLTRDSGSEYRLNGSGCRLLDVQDLFGGLGLGREMHSVISQGKVDSLLNSTPEARRALVEEAAGLGRFKKRRERAEAKLERTRQNLLRVGDVEREVRSALRPLRQQVAAAEKYAEATEEWALAKGKQLFHTLVGVRESLGATEKDMASAEARVREIGEALAALRRARLAEEERLAAALVERERVNALFHRARAQAEQMEGRAAALRQRLARAEGELDRSRRRLVLARSEAAMVAERLAEAAAATDDEARLSRVGAWSETLRARLEECLPAYRAAVAAEDDLKDSVFESEAARSRTLQDREFLRRQLDERGRAGAELAKAAEETSARLQQLEEEGAGLENKLQQARLAVEGAQSALRRAAIDREAARDAADEAARAEASIAERLAGLEARQTVLSDVLARREGAPAGARALLEGGGDRHSLTELLKVRPGYERAAAAALSGLAQAVVVGAADELLRAFEVSGPLEAIKPLGNEEKRSAAADWGDPRAGSRPPSTPMPPGTIDLWDLVDGPEEVIRSLRCLLPPTAVLDEQDGLGPVETLAQTMSAGGAGGGWQIVTRSGEVVYGGVLAARRQEAGAEAVLRSRNELEAVMRELEALSGEREMAVAAVQSAAAGLSESEARFRQCEEHLHESQRALTAQVGDCDLHARRVEQARVQAAEVQSRRERESGLESQYRAQLDAVEEGLRVREAELEKARADLRALQLEVAGMRETVAKLEEKKSQAALAEVRLRERCRSRENERARTLAQRDAADREAVRCERRVQSFEAYLPALGRLLEVTETLGDKARAVVTALEETVEATRARTEGTAGTMRDREGVEAGLQVEMQQMTAKSTDLRVACALLEDRKAALEEELAELCRRHMSPRRLVPDDVAGEDADSLAAAVERAERRRERIGPINPLAEQECAEMEERARFLAEQRADLEASLSQLQDVISELDAHIETTFSEIFESAKQHFSAVIASVFPGAKGNLKLTEPKPTRGARRVGTGGDAGEAVGITPEEAAGALVAGEESGGESGGIDIEVRFPNKSPRSLSLLSGGEKAMTAIAFLFSLFLARPCPFYILDEVEASLDDINIRRFLTLVRKYKDKTQFIIITHQRQTMEVADTLYGVTLESDGTSRVLSRRLATAKGA